MPGTDMYHRTKFHADRYHHRGDICHHTNNTSALAKHITYGGGQISDLRDRLEVPPQKGEDTSGTHMYHHAKCHTDRCHRRRDICNQKNRTESEVPCHTNI